MRKRLASRDDKTSLDIHAPKVMHVILKQRDLDYGSVHLLLQMYVTSSFSFVEPNELQ